VSVHQAWHQDDIAEIPDEEFLRALALRWPELPG
jgi:hypothetical protein